MGRESTTSRADWLEPADYSISSPPGGRWPAKAADGGVTLVGVPDWASLRAEFSLLDRYIHLDACSLGPLPRAGRAGPDAYARACMEKGTPALLSMLPLLERLRGRFA